MEEGSQDPTFPALTRSNGLTLQESPRTPSKARSEEGTCQKHIRVPLQVVDVNEKTIGRDLGLPAAAAGRFGTRLGRACIQNPPDQEILVDRI